MTGSQLNRIKAALLSAYPTESDLAQLLRIELDESLDAIAGGSNQDDRIFALLRWAESRGRIDRLMQAAIRHNPGNPGLIALASTMRFGSQVEAEQGSGAVDSVHSAEDVPGARVGTPFIGIIPYDTSGSDGTTVAKSQVELYHEYDAEKETHDDATKERNTAYVDYG